MTFPAGSVFMGMWKSFALPHNCWDMIDTGKSYFRAMRHLVLMTSQEFLEVERGLAEAIWSQQEKEMLLSL